MTNKKPSPDEINNYYHKKQRISDRNSIITKGTKWNLSNSHNEKDICDVYATQDLYGLGSGVYPSDKLPERHDGCKCYLTSVLYEGEELINILEKKYNKDNPKIHKKYLTESAQTNNGCLMTIIISILLFIILIFIF